MYHMFNSATGFNQDVSVWDVSRVTIFDEMFYHEQWGVFSQDLCAWKHKTNASRFDMFVGMMIGVMYAMILLVNKF